MADRPETGPRYTGSREDGLYAYNRDVDEASKRDSNFLAKLAVIGFGTHVLGRAVGRNILADLINKAGIGAKWAGGLYKRKGPGILRPEVANRIARSIDGDSDFGKEVAKRTWDGANLEEIDGVRDLLDGYGILTDPKMANRQDEISSWLGEYFARDAKAMARPAWYGDSMHHDLERLTFGDILSNLDAFFKPDKIASANTSYQVQAIQASIKKGWITSNTVVGPKLFKRISPQGKFTLIDTRLTDPGYALRKLATVTDMAGLTTNMASMFGSARNLASLGSTTRGGPQRVFAKTKIGSSGSIFELKRGGGIEEIESGRRLGRRNDPLFKASILRRMRAEGIEHEAYIGQEKGAGWFKRLQHAAGVGPEFQERPGGLIQTLLRAVRSIRAVHTGKATFAAKRYKSQDNSLVNMLLGSRIAIEKSVDLGIQKARFADKAGKPFRPNLLNRLKTYAGMSEDIEIVKATAFSPGRTELRASDLFFPSKTGGLKPLTSSMGASRAASSVTRTGDISTTRVAEYYTSSANRLDKAYDFANYLAIRLNTLSSSQLLGIGFRASGSLAGNVTRLMSIPAIYTVGLEAAKYADYEIGQVTGVRPSEVAADMYTKARVLQQQVRGATGIRAGAETFETTFPGISAGVAGTGLAGLGAVAALKGSGSFKLAGIAGAAIYAAMGGPDVAQTSESLKKEYAGIEKVPVREASWWGLGYQPFWGGSITHHEPSWYQKLKKQPYKTNVYGSEADYWSKGSILPNPRNLFGLSKVLDPYYLEKKHYYNRPYPISSGLGEEIPIIGPLFADTIGSIIKPRVRMHESDAQAVVAGNLRQRGAPKGIATHLGIPELPMAQAEFGRPDLVQARLQKYANVALEPAGIWKFALGYFGIKFDEGYHEATATNMGSVSRAFYEAGLGGALGETELLRRFLLSEYGSASKINQQINPIPNTMARWMPGSMSNFKEDRGAFHDFHRGDPYSKIRGGEYLLPGKGYESVNSLHGREAEVEHEKLKFSAKVVRVVDGDTVDVSVNGGVQRVRLAETMAPESDTPEGQAALHALNSLISPGDSIVLETTRDEFDSGEQTGPYGRIIGRLYKKGRNVNRAMVDAGHAVQIDSSYDAVDRFLILSNVAPYSKAYREAEREMKYMKLTEDWQARVDAAYSQREAKLDRFGFKKYRQQQLAEAELSPTLRTVSKGYQGIRENLLSEVPMLGSKLFPKLDPVDHYRKFEVEGSDFADWNEPYESIVRPGLYSMMGGNPLTAAVKGGTLAALSSSSIGRWLNPIAFTAYPKDRVAMMVAAAGIGGAASTARMAVTGKLEGGFTPPHIEKERELNEYFDQLKYLKYSNIVGAAEEVGDQEAVSYAAKQARKTILFGLHALESRGDVFAYKGGLEAKEKAYFEAFVDAPESDRGDILAMTPEHMQRALRSVWSASRNRVRPVEQQAEEYWDEHAMPEPGWIGWHPGIDDTAVKVKAIEGGINGISSNIHRFGLFPSQSREANARFGYLGPPVNDIHPASNTFELPWKVKQRGGNILSEFNFGAGAALNVANIRLNDDRRSESFYFANYIR